MNLSLKYPLSLSSGEGARRAGEVERGLGGEVGTPKDERKSPQRITSSCLCVFAFRKRKK